MDHRLFSARAPNLLLTLGCAAALAGLACGEVRMRGPITGGAGGAMSGGSGGAGGGESGSGGLAGGEGGLGGGTGGTGGSTTTQGTSCASNGDCSGATPLCEPVREACVQCIASSDCPPGDHCLGNQCVTFSSCNNSPDCDSGLVCDPGRGICVECAQVGDCANDQACVLNKCITLATCQSASDCGAKLCDTSNGRCVECVSDTDCAAGTERCLLGTCRTTCTTNQTCVPLGMLCDTTNSVCTGCLSNTDCPASSYCEGGACRADICDSAQSTCAGNGVSSCNAAGNGWATATACAPSQSCTAYGGVASCGGAVPTDAGPPSPDSGLPPTDAPAVCTTATATPCTTIPKFNATQVLDGKDDDFCDVPSFTFGVANAASKNDYNNIPDSQFEIVTAKVAWSAAGLSAFFDVADTSVQTVNMADPSQAIDRLYVGDSIELYISSSDAVTGLTGTDGNALHVTVPANGPAVSVKATSGSAATHTELPAAQYAQATTSTGYAIELKLPWPGSAPSAGTRIRFDLALNSADKTFGNLDDMRDGQLLFYLGTTGGATSCSGAADAWCDDRTWCSTLLQ